MTYNPQIYVDVVRSLDPGLPEDTSPFKTAVVLLTAAEVATDGDVIGDKTRYGRKFVRERNRRLRQVAPWYGRAAQQLASKWLEDPTSRSEFWNFVLIADGHYDSI